MRHSKSSLAARSVRVALALLALLACAGNAFAQTAPVESGGILTRTTDNRNSFALPAPTLDAAGLREFNFGNRLFNTNWTVAPASANGFDGLGPTFNRVSCSACHLRDGRGRPPQNEETELLSMLVRISLPGSDVHGGPKPHPDYGDQLNDRAIPGIPAEGRVTITFEEQPGSYADGSAYSLRKPHITLHDSAFGPFDDLLFSARTAQHMTGMGLLESVSEADIVSREDPDDKNSDGISGRANRVWNPVTRRVEIGRFGWKANAATLLQQSAAAANGDIGLTSSTFPNQNCPGKQTACAAAPNGGEPELSDTFLEKIVAYLRTLAVPAQRNPTGTGVIAGGNVFKEMNCGSCHVPNLRTQRDATPTLLADQGFAPYTDLLLHDMGEGLADHRPDFLASGTEWRTPPLWGVGLFQTVNDHTNYLHDGRARNLEEAILWHGGEAARAQRAFVEADADTRRALIEFLQSL